MNLTWISCSAGVVPAVHSVFGNTVRWSAATYSVSTKGPLVTMFSGDVHVSGLASMTCCGAGNVVQSAKIVLKVGISFARVSSSVVSSMPCADRVLQRFLCAGSVFVERVTTDEVAEAAPRGTGRGWRAPGRTPLQTEHEVVSCDGSPSDHFTSLLILTVYTAGAWPMGGETARSAVENPHLRLAVGHLVDDFDAALAIVA